MNNFTGADMKMLYLLRQAARAIFQPRSILSSVYTKHTSYNDDAIQGWHTTRYRSFQAKKCRGGRYVIVDFNSTNRTDYVAGKNVAGTFSFIEAIQKMMLLEQELVVRGWTEAISSSRRGKDGMANLSGFNDIPSLALNIHDTCYDIKQTIAEKCQKEKRQKYLFSNQFRMTLDDAVPSREEQPVGIRGFKPFIIIDNTPEPK